MTDPEIQPEHPTSHSDETAEATDDLGKAVVLDPREAHPADVDDTQMRTPGGVNTEIDRIFGDDSER